MSRDIRQGKQYKRRELLLFALYLWLLFGLLGWAVYGCAGREPSSTDHHDMRPSYCGVISVNGRLQEYCCQDQACWLLN